MSVRPRSILLGLVLAAMLGATGVWSATPAKPAPPASPNPEPKVTRFVDGRPDTGSFLPDTTVLARVGDRTITAREFVRSWFNAWAPDLPAPDSAGRAQFLNSMVTKDLLALEAQRLNVQLGFEDRLEMREYRQRMLANVLFRRAVTDSVKVTEEEIRNGFEGFRTQIKIRHILFDNPDLAATVRSDLLAKRIGWDEAARRYSRDVTTRESGGDLGWAQFGNAPPVVAVDIWPLPVGSISHVFKDDDGYHLAQVTERRPATAPDYNAGQRIVAGTLEGYRSARRLEALHDAMRARIHLVYDAGNIEFASSRFGAVLKVERDARGGTSMTYNDVLPDFEPADTARVLARYDGGMLSLGRFLDLYSHVSVMARPDANSPGLLRKAIEGFLLEPSMADEAAARGLEQDPIAVRNMSLKREQLMVQHLYQDSVGAHVWLDPKERRKFYDEHLAAYYTFPKAEFAAMSFRDRESADAVATLLRGGADVHQVLADSVKHRMIGGSIMSRKQNEGGPYQKLLFEGMRPGNVELTGPGKDGSWFVLKLMTYDPGRQLSYDEAAQYVDDDTQKVRSEELLAAFVERLKQRHRWWGRPDLVMGIRLSEQ